MCSKRPTKCFNACQKCSSVYIAQNEACHKTGGWALKTYPTWSRSGGKGSTGHAFGC